MMCNLSRSRRRVLGFLPLAIVFLFSSVAFAQQDIHLVWPEIGLGPGAYVFNGNAGSGLQIDASIGFELDGDPWRVFGGMLRTDFILLSSNGDGLNEIDSLKFDIVALFTSSSSYEYGKPFLRASAGPLTSFTNVDGNGGIGFGAVGEFTAGFKSMFDLSFDVRASFDAVGVSLGAGLVMRINPLFYRFFRRRGYGS